MKLFSLSIHADYRCHNSGACCSADWDIPVELPVYRTLVSALSNGGLRPADAANDAPFITDSDLPDSAAAILARTRSGECVFFHGGSRLCVVHRDLGEPALPLTCRHFPRVAVRDWRGTFITLSHFCPTAAGMLFRDDVPLEIVESPPAFPPGDYQGLVVDPDAWPPLLRPRMLMDLEGYSAWERHMVSRCADPTRTPESVVATLSRDARMLREWTPGGMSLVEAVAALPAAYVDASPPARLQESLRMRDDVVMTVEDDLKPPFDEGGLDSTFMRVVLPAWPSFRRPVNRYLAAKAFASWTAYQGYGVLSIVRGLEAALAVVRVESARECRNADRVLDANLLREAFRSADHLLNHLAVGQDLAKLWSRAEPIEGKAFSVSSRATDNG